MWPLLELPSVSPFQLKLQAIQVLEVRDKISYRCPYLYSKSSFKLNSCSLGTN